MGRLKGLFDSPQQSGSARTITPVKWIGPLTTQGNTPGQRAIVVGSDEGTKHSQLRTVAVGELSRVSLHTQQPGQSHPPDVREQFLVDFDQQQCLPLMTKESALLPIASILPSSIQLFMRESKCVCLPLKTSEDPLGIIIPVAELLRHCYGSSSRLLQAVLSDELPKLLKEAENLSVVAGTQRRFQAVPAELDTADLHMLTHLLAEPLARQRALNVNINISAAFTAFKGADAISHPTALFPFSGQHRLTAQGRWVVTGTTRRFLVHRIIQLNVPSLITPALPIPPMQNQPTDMPPQPRSRGARAGRKNDQLDSSQTTRPGNAIRAIRTQHSVFSNLRIGRFDAGLAPHPASLSNSIRAAGPQLSTSPWKDREAIARPVTLAEVIPTSLPEFRPLVDAVAYLRAEGHQITERPLAQNRAQQGFFCLIYAVRLTSGWAYLVEKDRPRPSVSGPLIVCWKENHGEASDAELLSLLSIRIGQRTWPKDTPGWTLRRITHGYSTPETFGNAIASALK